MNRVLGFRSRLVGGGVAIALMIGLAACGGPPKWVKQGSGAFNEKDSKGFYGVGSVAGVRNEPLAWDTAENRARAEIAKTFETYTGYLMRDYAASTTAGDFTKNTEEQNVERATKAELWAPGEDVRLSWSPDHTFVVADEVASSATAG